MHLSYFINLAHCALYRITVLRNGSPSTRDIVGHINFEAESPISDAPVRTDLNPIEHEDSFSNRVLASADESADEIMDPLEATRRISNPRLHSERMDPNTHHPAVQLSGNASDIHSRTTFLGTSHGLVLDPNAHGSSPSADGLMSIDRWISGLSREQDMGIETNVVMGPQQAKLPATLPPSGTQAGSGDWAWVDHRMERLRHVLEDFSIVSVGLGTSLIVFSVIYMARGRAS